MVINMLLIGSHVSFKKDKELLGSLEEALSYGSNTFMFYTGAPQNTIRYDINMEYTKKAYELMAKNNIDINKIIVHAPYIINLGNKENIDKYNFSIDFLTRECKRCEKLGMKYLVLHPGNHLGIGIENAILNISDGLNTILDNTSVTILLETMAGKGTEVGSKFEELKAIIDEIEKKNQIGICMDTCHMFDSGYDISHFDKLLGDFDMIVGIEKIGCIHINDSKNISGSKKDRHANLGYGNLGFDNLINIIYNERLKNVPKILETPYIDIYPPYRFEIDMIKNKIFNPNLNQDVIDYYK